MSAVIRRRAGWARTLCALCLSSAVMRYLRETITGAILTADLWLTDNDTGLQPRYDIAEVTLAGEPPRVVDIRVYEDAFTTDGVYTVN